jgi:hypothetical protein
MAWAEGWCHAVWEDDRSGNTDVYTARRPCAGPGTKAKQKP